MNLKDVASVSKVKDIIYVISFVIFLATFFVNEGKNRQKQDDLIEEVKEIKETLKDQERLLQKQLVLNGKIIMYMELDQALHKNNNSQ